MKNAGFVGTMKWVPYSVGFFPRREGFTVLRLLVAMAIAAMLVGAASPNIAGVTRVYSVRSAARQVYSELQNARMSAVMANQSNTFTINGGGTTYTRSFVSTLPVEVAHSRFMSMT
jgi:Tfp pilus assembly protein FimT